jgi:hypothetical protein
MLRGVQPGELKGDLSFLASDTLAGRFTPSPGLDVAAEFIASKFRAAGLEPGGNDGYFQTAEMTEREAPAVTDFKLGENGRTETIPATSVSVFQSSQAAKIENAPVLLFPERELAALDKSSPAGKVVVVRAIDYSKLSDSAAMDAYRKVRQFDSKVAASGAVAEIVVEAKDPAPSSSRLLTPEQAGHTSEPPVLRVASSKLESWLGNATSTESRTISFDLPAPHDHSVQLKNVIGILRGSDPQLSKTCVLLTAHYDHIGTVETAVPYTFPFAKDSKDRVFNGANDDGSGTVSVIEIARAMAQMRVRPRRSIVFMTFFGEERGELGSQYYGKHPVFPIRDTVADINLEQVGRTDATTGKQVNTASPTGFDYSDVVRYLIQAGRDTGIRVYKDPEASDAYFTRSDNDALAQQGVPAHSLTVAFDFADYHRLGDEWQKIDYDNMARVDRMIALALWRMANSERAPQWNAQNAKTAPFREAQAKLRDSK